MTAWAGQTPRRWQVEALGAVREAARAGSTSLLVQACTGAGKSTFLAEVIASARGSVLVTTPTQALTDQLGATLEARLGPGVVGRCYQHAWQPDARVVVTCHASLDRLLTSAPRTWGLWVADEAHRLEGATLRAARDRLRRSLAVGLTATPYTAGPRRLQWDRLVYEYSARQAVEDCVLVPWRVRTWDGQGSDDTDDIVAAWVASAEGPGVVSARTIVDAEAYAARLGPTVAAVHSQLRREEVERRIARLRAGELRALVHVSLLAEGVDLPWLRWLALRRPVSSRVRVVQEVGRVLRAAPGKTEAVLYDPHDLVRSVGLQHVAQIDAAAPEDEAAVPEAESWEIPELEGLGELATLPAAVAVTAVEAWVGELRARLLAAGIVRQGSIEGRAWRHLVATPGQREALGKAQRWAGRLRDERHRSAFRWLLEREELTRGSAADAIDCLSGIRQRWAQDGTRRWMVPNELVPGM